MPEQLITSEEPTVVFNRVLFGESIEVMKAGWSVNHDGIEMNILANRSTVGGEPLYYLEYSYIGEYHTYWTYGLQSLKDYIHFHFDINIVLP